MTSGNPGVRSGLVNRTGSSEPPIAASYCSTTRDSLARPPLPAQADVCFEPLPIPSLLTAPAQHVSYEGATPGGASSHPAAANPPHPLDAGDALPR